ncbi:hypothetical protein HYV71_01375 [Candidatus Uhrbacteria bacterium]|nr:hypothetical protein [Candidatus Uhrbacteria bacterium]
MRSGEEPKKEEPKKEEPKKEVVEDPSKRFIGKPCDPVLPRSWQQGCIDETAQKETPAIKYYVPDSSGKQCRDDIAITFQPGCVPVIQPEAVNRFIGQTCDPILPRSWQQGCIDPKEKQLNEKPAVQYYAPDSVGKQCRDDIAITFQPGCVPVKKPEPVDRFAGKPCDPILPRSWQQGCIPPASEAQQQKTTTPAKSAAQSSATTQKQTAPKCNPQVPHYSQPGCVD